MSLNVLPLRTLIVLICGILAGLMMSSLLANKKDSATDGRPLKNSFSVQLSSEILAKGDKETKIGSRIFLVKIGKSLHLRDSCKVHRRPAKLLGMNDSSVRLNVNAEDLLLFKSIVNDAKVHSNKQPKFYVVAEKEASAIRYCVRYQQVSYAM